MSLADCFVLLAAGLFVVCSAADFSNKPGRDLVVLSAPSIWDLHYREHFLELIQFQMEFAKMVLGHDNVIVLADRHTMPFLDGRSHEVRDRLPTDVLLEADVYDVRLRDFAPFGIRDVIKFNFRPRDMDELAARQIDGSMQRFLKKHDIHVDKREAELALCGADVVDNGVDKAIVNERVVVDNHDNLPEWAIMIKLLNAFRKVAMIDAPMNETASAPRLDDAVAFVDESVLVLAAMPDDERRAIDAALYKKFRNEVSIIDLPTNASDDGRRHAHSGTCGMYTTLLATDHFVYVPVFGNDPSNWQMGHSVMLDQMVVKLLQVNTHKTVVPINLPRAVCSLGLGPRSLSWHLRGAAADKLVQLGKYYGRRRFFHRRR